MADTFQITVRRDDVPLLVGILEEAVRVGVLALQESDRYDLDTLSHTRMHVYRLKEYIRQLRDPPPF